MTSASGSLTTPVDPLRIEQVLDNLLENAQKYSAGDPVEVRAWSEDGEARIAVTDHGIGIPADNLPRIFDRFFRASNVDSRARAGMGLGLFICRRIVEEHDGRIWAESEPGEGSTFHIALPLHADRTEPMPSAHPPQRGEEVAADA